MARTVLIPKKEGEEESTFASIRVPLTVHNRFMALAKESGYSVPELRRLAYIHYLNSVTVSKKEETPNV